MIIASRTQATTAIFAASLLNDVILLSK